MDRRGSALRRRPASVRIVETKLGLLLALAAGGAMEAPLSCQNPPAGRPATTTDKAAAEKLGGSPPRTRILDADGDPLPSSTELDLQEDLRTALPAVANQKASPPPASPITAPPHADDGDIVVAGVRPRGSVVGDLPPERTFGPFEINAYGASNVRELLPALGPQVSNGRTQDGSGPLTLLNGRRVSSFTEIAEIPTEAIERMEVFPEELALRYGYGPDRKVVNIVTFEKFSSLSGQVSELVSTEGGYRNLSVQPNHFAIRGNTRFGLGADYGRTAPLLESDRDLRQPDGTRVGGGYRTLVPGTERLAVNGLISGNLLDDVSSTLNGRYETSSSESLLGLGSDGPLTRDVRSNVGHLGTTLSGVTGRWLWSFTSNYDRTITDTSTDAGEASSARDEARSVNSTANADLVLNGSVLKLPAGPVSTSLRGGIEMRDFSGRSSRGGVMQGAALSRDRGMMQANLDVPIASRRANGSSWLGNLSVNANLAVDGLSDLGTLRTFGYGFNWSPITAISLIASVTNQESAPTVEQLGTPLVVTPNVRTFDFARREVTDVTQAFGGNPNLRSDDRRVTRLGVNSRPFSAIDLTVSIEYLETRIDDPIASFPIVTPQVEAAFPERFTRDIGGRLSRIDNTPLNFERSDQEQVRWGFSFVRPLGAVESWMRSAPVRSYSNEAEARAAAPPGAMVAMVQPGSAMARRFENLSSRLFVNLYHTWRLRDEVLLRTDMPRLDLLDGQAIDFMGGARRHRLELQAGVFKKGLGGRVTVNWQSGSTVHDLGGGAGDLTFSDLATVNVNLFANLADHFGETRTPHWLKETRISFGINNLFNERQDVRDGTGSTPLSYQRAYLDPLGRSLSLSVRKVF